MTETEKKNSILIELNNSYNQVIIDIKSANNFIEEEIEADNIVDIYRDKMLEFEKKLKKIDCTFYTNNILGSVILSYMDQIYIDSFKILTFIHKIASNCSYASPFYYICQSLIIKGMNKYKSNCELLSDLSLEKHIIKMLKIYFKKKRIVLPGKYIEEYYSLKKVLRQFDSSDLILKIEKSIEPLIRKIELQNSILYEKIKKEIQTDSDEEVKLYLEKQIENKIKHL